MNFKTKNILKFLVYCYINTLILSSLKPDIFPQGKDKTTNWPEPVFEHLTIADGLPENSVFSILQDRFGYMWLGTQNGLVRYDGYDMKVYTRVADDSLSISGAVISAIYEDNSGTLLGGTNNSLYLFDRETEKFKYVIYEGPVYSPAVYEYIQSLADGGKRISSILQVGDNAKFTKTFIINKKTIVLTVVMYETGGYEAGWLENSTGKIIAGQNNSDAINAGGNNKNLIQIYSRKVYSANEY